MTQPRGTVRGWRIAGVLFGSALALFGGTVNAKVLIHTARTGDTAQSLAAEYYGNRALSYFIVETNGIGRSERLTPGRAVRIPTAFHYRMKRGDTLEALAARLLDDKRRAPFLAQWSGLGRGDKGHEGTDLLVAFQFVHKATAPESVASIARAFYGDAGQARSLLAYNFRSSPMLAPGERLVVPVTHVRVRAVRLATVRSPSSPQREQHEKEVPEAPRGDADRREAELAARVAERLRRAEVAWREGRYDDVPTALTKLLSEEDPSEVQLVAIHRLLAFAYVALGADEVAVREFCEVLERDPAAKLDEATVSPKIRGAFDRAKTELQKRVGQ